MTAPKSPLPSGNMGRKAGTGPFSASLFHPPPVPVSSPSRFEPVCSVVVEAQAGSNGPDQDGREKRKLRCRQAGVPGNLGCFKDSGDPPTLSGTSETSNKLTIQNCISFCRRQRYKLAGMESGYACFCGNEVDLRDQGPSPNMECNHVCFGDHTQPCGGDGWVIIFDTRVGACGGNYTSPSGVVYSPDFPDKYGAGRVCYWTIQVPGSSAILFNFTFFDISDQTDMVELLDGYSNQVVARFDWRSPPRELVNITGDFVIVYFYSDRTNQAQGFALLYQGTHALIKLRQAALLLQSVFPLENYAPSFYATYIQSAVILCIVLSDTTVSLRTLRSEDTRTMEAEGDGEEEGEDVSSTAGPQLAGGVTERSNSTSNERSSHILYVITSSPGKPEHNMPGQWAGRGETTGHNASMLTPMIHSTYCNSLYLCRDDGGHFLASASF
ncbi:hypothetical protein Q8A73_011488 [Channa argus]|nr:hypothetical protein Q8A73_011488 [Channa argus]